MIDRTYGIRATNRTTNKREFIVRNLTASESEAWVVMNSRSWSKSHKYFRIAKTHKS